MKYFSTPPSKTLLAIVTTFMRRGDAIDRSVKAGSLIICVIQF